MTYKLGLGSASTSEVEVGRVFNCKTMAEPQGGMQQAMGSSIGSQLG